MGRLVPARSDVPRIAPTGARPTWPGSLLGLQEAKERFVELLREAEAKHKFTSHTTLDEFSRTYSRDSRFLALDAKEREIAFKAAMDELHERPCFEQARKLPRIESHTFLTPASARLGMAVGRSQGGSARTRRPPPNSAPSCVTRAKSLQRRPTPEYAWHACHTTGRVAPVSGSDL